MSEATFDYEIVDSLKPGITSKAAITRLDTAKASDIYKSKAKNADQKLVVIYGKVEHDGWEGRVGVISLPITKQITLKTKMAQFKQRYKQFPKVGMKVDVETDENGYWKIAL